MSVVRNTSVRSDPKISYTIPLSQEESTAIHALAAKTGLLRAELMRRAVHLLLKLGQSIDEDTSVTEKPSIFFAKDLPTKHCHTWSAPDSNGRMRCKCGATYKK